jgi:esterase/lipase
MEGTSISGMPDGGYVAQLTENAPLIPLVESIAAHLGVPVEGLSLVCEGNAIDTSLGVKDQDFNVPIPSQVMMAKRGRKIELVVTLRSGVSTHEDVAAREAEQRQAREAKRIKDIAQNLIDAVEAAQKSGRPDIQAIDRALEAVLAEDRVLMNKHVDIKKADSILKKLQQEERKRKAMKDQEDRLQNHLKRQRERRDALHLQLVEPPKEERDALRD